MIEVTPTDKRGNVSKEPHTLTPHQMIFMVLKYLLWATILLSIIPATLIFIESFIEEKDYGNNDDTNDDDN